MMTEVTKRFAAGYTVLELIVTVAIVSILLAVGIPSLRDLFDALALKGASEEVWSSIQQARSEAIARDTNIYVRFSASATPSAAWVYGMSDFTSCDLSQTTSTGTNACTLVIDDGDGIVHNLTSLTDTDDLVLMRYVGDPDDSIVMSITSFNTDKQIMFEPAQGTVRDAATATFRTGSILMVSPRGKQLQINVAPLGQIRICSPDGSVNGYAGC